MTTQPQVTVLMSCYNAARWLSESIDSILTQTFQDFEFIIIDDGSTDATLSIIQSFSRLDRRIVVVQKPNTGLADSLNIGIHRARGVWIARLDADDISAAIRLERQLAYVRRNPGIVFLGSGLIQIDEAGKKLATFTYPSRHSTLLKNLTTARKFPAHSSAFYASKAARAVGGYRTRLRRAQDWDLWLRLSELGKLACLPDPLVRIRRHANQISHDESGRRQIVDSRIAIISYFLRRRDFPDPVAGEEREFEAFRLWLTQHLEMAGVFGFENLRTQFRASRYNARHSFARSVQIIKVAVRHPLFLVNLMHPRRRQSDLPRRLACAWMRVFKGVPEAI